ncbi:uncharacterized protein T551_01196 [Pneumocystis jirovecii RU7]|uniref:SHSP domain-containing protein n=1 Tax=Pneumocystis jirovecii (strain RU7) TaxID=1408657 RepID=A0A0W4ZRW9_PNEJ7|nr:uncharacterized protein T551_01196 [Pneumocystis jirovecii RU7]KTW31123.1 hypothetical protein T551_01196 [Pneumocystis jirovecii RU7]
MVSISQLAKQSLFPIDLGHLVQALDQPMYCSQLKGNLNNRCLMPKIDMSESSQYYIIEVELPGLKKENLLLEFIDETTILIEGCIKRQISDKFAQYIPAVEGALDKNVSEDDPTYVKIHVKNNLKELPQATYWYKERVLGQFSRTISFPTSVDRDNVKASLENGLLYIMVPKSAASAPKKIVVD